MNLDRLAHQPRPLARLAEPELLLQYAVLEPLVLGEPELQAEVARRLVEVEARDFECGEALGEDLRVRGLDEVVDFGRRLLEDKGPEVWDARDY